MPPAAGEGSFLQKFSFPDPIPSKPFHKASPLKTKFFQNIYNFPLEKNPQTNSFLGG
jgi:hypothetical protein